METPLEQRERRETRQGPTRTCVGCGLRDDAKALVRLVVERELAHGEVQRALVNETVVAFDLANGAFGRGAHVHARPACLEKAPRGLARTLRVDIKIDSSQLGRALVVACDRRIEGLVIAARRLRALAIGADAALEALRRGAPLAIVAADAGTIAHEIEVVRCVAEGRTIVWSTRGELGALLGERSVAICGVRHAGIAAELKRMRAAADAGMAATREGAGCSSRCPEAR